MRDFHERFAAAIAVPIEGPLAIYRNTVAAGLSDALAANFPVVRALLGDEMFAAVAVDFAAAHPPADPVLAHYGFAFAEWIEEQEWAVGLPYLSEVARVERLYCEALFAADAAPLDPAAFARLAPGEWSHARLTLHPATRFACSRWPAAGLWLAHRAGGDPAAVAWQPECVLVTRPHLTVEVEVFGAAEHRFLMALACGGTIAATVEATLAAWPDADIASAFSLLIARGAFAALIV